MAREAAVEFVDGADAVDAWTFNGTVPGSGPFTLVSNDAQAAVLERRDGWWGTTPAMRRIEVRAVADPQATWNPDSYQVLARSVGGFVLLVARRKSIAMPRMA